MNTSAARYREPLREMLDRVLEIGRMPDGMLANITNPLEGKAISVGLRIPNPQKLGRPIQSLVNRCE